MRGAPSGWVLWLWAGCAAAPSPAPVSPAPTAPPTLAGVVAPEPVRAELSAPLTALLGGQSGAVLIALGQDEVRCEAEQAPGRVRLTCEGQSEEASDRAGLVRILHTGTLLQRVVQARLDDDAGFRERTGLQELPPPPEDTGAPALPPQHPSGTGRVRDLDSPFGRVRFEAGEAGQEVRARYFSPEGEEVIEARSLPELGHKLNAHRQELSRARSETWVIHEEVKHLRTLLAHLRWGVDGWQLGEVRPGQPESALPRLKYDPEPTDILAQAWPERWHTVRLDLVRPDPFTISVRGETLLGDRVVRRVEARASWGLNDVSFYNTPVDCRAHERDLREMLATGVTHERKREANQCVWRWRAGSQEVELAMSRQGTDQRMNEGFLRVSWQPEQQAALVPEAQRVLEAREHERACRACPSRRPGEVVERLFRVHSVDLARCTMKAMTFRTGREHELPCHKEPPDAFREY